MFIVTKKVLNFQIEVRMSHSGVHTHRYFSTLHQNGEIVTRYNLDSNPVRCQYRSGSKQIFCICHHSRSLSLSLSLSLSIYIYIYLCVCVFSRKMYLKLFRLKFFTGMVAKSGITP